MLNEFIYSAISCHFDEMIRMYAMY